MWNSKYLQKNVCFCSCYTNKQPMLHVYNLDKKRLVCIELFKSVLLKEPIIHKVPKQ